MISLDEAMLYAPVEWHDCSEGYTDIRYHKSTDGIAKITINRPQVRNAFRPLTVKEMIQALADARYDDNIGVIVLTGEGEKAFCAGGGDCLSGADSGKLTEGHSMISLDEAMLYAPVEWHDCSEGYTDIRYHKSTDGIAKITINRPQVRNAFRPLTVKEMIQALADARYDDNIGVIVLTGEGEKAFCAGGDQKVRGDYGGYQDDSGVHHLNVLDFQRQIRTCPKPVVAMVAGYSIGGGHVLHMMCDLTIAAENAIFGQTGPKVGSFDGGWGASYMARIVGQKKAREIWFLCRQYDAQQALDMGLVNTVVPLADLEKETVRWCREMLQNSPMALRCLKAALNADCDGQAGLQELAGNATMLFYMTEEGQEGRNAFNQKRQPDFSKFKRNP